MKRIELHIEELVLYGFAPADRHHIGDAAQRELTRLLTEQGMPASLIQRGEIARLDSGAFQMAQGSKAEAIGDQVAQAVYRGLSR